jgi:predicted nucleic acid-binding protein
MRQARWLIDTNVLLRLMNKHLAEHRVCAAAMERLRHADVLFLFCLQNAAEFWNVSTRPVDRNGFALTPDETALNLKHIAETMTFLADDGKVFAEWRRLVAVHQVRGVQVHDARLVASMIVHEVPQILALNVADFSRFPEVQAVHPATLLQ